VPRGARSEALRAERLHGSGRAVQSAAPLRGVPPTAAH
jgi:hypothetical protein